MHEFYIINQLVNAYKGEEGVKKPKIVQTSFKYGPLGKSDMRKRREIQQFMRRTKGRMLTAQYEGSELRKSEVNPLPPLSAISPNEEA